MRRFLEISSAGLDALLRYPLRSLVTVACLVVMLTPYLVGLGISQGLRSQAEDAVRYGADLYVSGNQFGRPAGIPLSAAARIEVLEGVTRVVPRIVGAVDLGRYGEPAVLVGMDPADAQAASECVRGRWCSPDTPNELVVGTELARKLSLEVGSRIPPFYHSSQGERVSTVVGVFRSDVPLWQANLVFATFSTASAVFDRPGEATDLLVWCRPGYQQSLVKAIQRELATPGEDGLALRPRVVTRQDLDALLPEGALHREGAFSLHFLLAFAVGIPLVLVSSGVGLTERRRETGVLKALGWQTDEVLLRSLVESLCLSLLAASLAVLAAFVWLRVFNGIGVAGLFLDGAEARPGFQVPFRLAPLPVALALLLSLVIVMTGTLISTWRAAVTPPAAAMR